MESISQELNNGYRAFVVDITLQGRYRLGIVMHSTKGISAYIIARRLDSMVVFVPVDGQAVVS